MVTLATIDAKGHQLDTTAAASWKRMQAAGLGTGAVTTAYRTYAEQAALYAAYKAGTGNYALKPGTSQHEQGLAVDVSGTLRTWMIANSADHGWKRTNSSEPWHFEYATSRDRHQADATTTAATVATTDVQEDSDMRIIAQKTRGTWLMGAGFAHKCSTEEWEYYSKYNVYPITTLPDGDVGVRIFDLHKSTHTNKTA